MSAGVAAIAYDSTPGAMSNWRRVTRIPPCSAMSGAFTDVPVPLISRSGAPMTTEWPEVANADARTGRPGASIPSSFVQKMRIAEL